MPTPAAKLDSAWYGFLCMAFIVVGLAGIFGTYIAQIPYERAEMAQRLLDRAASGQAIPPGAWGDNASIMDRASEPLAQRIGAARAATRARASAEARDLARRARVLIAVITAGGALFSCVLLGAAASQRRRPSSS